MSEIPAKAGIQHSLTCDCRIKVNPIWVLLFNQLNLPRSIPFFHLTFAKKCGVQIVVTFEIHQSVDLILSRKTFDRSNPMVINSCDQIRRCAYIKRSVLLTREDVNVRSDPCTLHLVLFSWLIWIPACAGIAPSLYHP